MGRRVPDVARAWIRPGRFVQLAIEGPGGARSHRLFVRDEQPPGSSKDTTTFFHGFPTSSVDWHRVRDLLPNDRRRIFLDHLGFGLSDKPRRHAYQIGEQVDLAVALWHRLDIRRTTLVVHDYSVSMAQEILARRHEGTWQGPDIDHIVFLNGGLFPGHYRPLLIQKLLRRPRIGPIVATLASRRTFKRSMDRIHHDSHPPRASDVAAQWWLMTQDHGKRAVPHTSAYQQERMEMADRWKTAIRLADVPMTFAWGTADPISGTMVDEIRSAAPNADLHTWDDVGHYPMLEMPAEVAHIIVQIEGGRAPRTAH